MQGFVSRTKVGVYSLKHVWEQAAARQEIMAAFLSDQRIKYELGRSELPLSARDLQPPLTASIQALVDSLQVSPTVLIILPSFLPSFLSHVRFA